MKKNESGLLSCQIGQPEIWGLPQTFLKQKESQDKYGISVDFPQVVGYTKFILKNFTSKLLIVVINCDCY